MPRLLACAASLLLALAAQGAPPPSPVVADEIRRIITEAHHPSLKWQDFRFYDGELLRFYEPIGFGLAWFENARPRKQVPEIIAALRTADERGLAPEDYDARWLEERWLALERRPAPGAQELALLDTALSLNLFRYLSDVHVGRIDPRDVGFQVDTHPRKHDLAKLVRDAVAADRLPQALAQAEPQYPMYWRLKEALRRYRRLAAEGRFEPLPVVKKLEPGRPYAGAAQLRNRLALVGDLPPDSQAGAGGVYDPDLVAAVKRFQERHGLVADGVIGKDSFDQLNTPPAARARQIELALERMRWLPQALPGPTIGINIPEFKLWAFEEEQGRPKLAFRMNVVVGKAMRTRTPVFADQMEYVVFSPYWNVPPSIARNEVIPDIRRDSAYLRKHDMEVVISSSGAVVGDEPDEETLQSLRRGEFRVRQRPGGKNALGGVKFVFPNNQNIYLHDTPSQSLFKRPRRDFSHGCIRVADPMQLARFVLRDMPEWTEQRIAGAMQSGRQQYVRLKHPTQVVIFYTTVIVEEDGLVRFLPDIYGHDRALDAALRAGYPLPS